MPCGYEPWRPFESDYFAGQKDAYRKEKSTITEMLINQVEEKLIPGLKSMIEVKESATPLTNVIMDWKKPGRELKIVVAY